MDCPLQLKRLLSTYDMPDTEDVKANGPAPSQAPSENSLPAPGVCAPHPPPRPLTGLTLLVPQMHHT